MLTEDEQEKLPLLEDLALLPERDRLNKELLLCRDYMPFVPPLVVKVDLKNPENSEVINNMIDQLSTAKFNV